MIHKASLMIEWGEAFQVQTFLKILWYLSYYSNLSILTCKGSHSTSKVDGQELDVYLLDNLQNMINEHNELAKSLARLRIMSNKVA